MCQVSTDFPFTRLGRSLPLSLPLSSNSYWKESAKSEKWNGKNWSGEIGDMCESREKDGIKNKNSYSINGNRSREGKRKNEYKVLLNKEEHSMENKNENENENENEKVFDHFPSFDTVNDINKHTTNTNESHVQPVTEYSRKNRAFNSGIKGPRSAGSGDSVSESIGEK